MCTGAIQGVDVRIVFKRRGGGTCRINLLTHLWRLDPGCCIAPTGHQGMKVGRQNLHHNHITSSVAVKQQRNSTVQLQFCMCKNLMVSKSNHDMCLRFFLQASDCTLASNSTSCIQELVCPAPTLHVSVHDICQGFHGCDAREPCIKHQQKHVLLESSKCCAQLAQALLLCILHQAGSRSATAVALTLQRCVA